MTYRDTRRKSRPWPAPGPECACGHAQAIHNAHGCEGLLTRFDGVLRLQFCACQGFTTGWIRCSIILPTV